MDAASQPFFTFRDMPRLSEFYGIAIYMYWQDHAPPHFHAFYAGMKRNFESVTGRCYEDHFREPPWALSRSGHEFIEMS